MEEDPTATERAEGAGGMQEAQLFSSRNSMTRVMTERLLREFLPRLRWSCEAAAGEKAAALDVGCGPGDLTADVLQPLLPPCVKTLVGMDLSPKMVEHASAHFASQHLRFVQGDIADRDISSTELGRQADALGGFCKVFSFYTLHWVQDQRTALDNIHRLLRSGGEGVLSFVSHSPIFTAYEELMQRPRWKSYMADVKSAISPYQHTVDVATAFTSVLQKAGFRVHYCKNLPIKHHFKSIKDFKGLIEAVNPFVQRVPQAEQAALFDEMTAEVQKAMRSMPNDGEGEVGPETYCYHTLVAYVEKEEAVSRG